MAGHATAQAGGETVRRIHSVDQISLYQCASTGPARILLCSTPSSRRLLTEPRLVGLGFRRALGTAVAEALRAVSEATPDGAESIRRGGLAVLNILRGGLSFGVEDAVAEVLGTDPAVSFVGTERTPDRPVKITYDRWELGLLARSFWVTSWGPGALSSTLCRPHSTLLRANVAHWPASSFSPSGPERGSSA